MLGTPRLLGFDVREARPAPWPADRRERHLLRADVTHALSIDDVVWPRTREHSLLLETPPPRAEGSVVIAIEWLDAGIPCDRFFPLASDLSPTGWDRLGHDVADAGEISALSNCGYRDDERASFRATWGPKLNAHHLFDHADDALSFVQASNARVPEHAPFFAFALWRQR